MSCTPAIHTQPISSKNLNVSVGNPTQLVFSIHPSNAAVGASLGNVSVRIEDSHGNTVTTETTPITVAIGVNAGPSGTLSGALTLNAVSGVASFTDLLIDTVGSGYTLTANASGLTAATSSAFNITPSTLSLIAGVGDIGGLAKDGVGTAARFNNPSVVTSDGTNLYVVDDQNMVVRKMVIATGQVTTLAGAVGQRGASDSTDGTGATARFNNPSGGIVAIGGFLYLSDTGGCAIRKIDLVTGNTTTLAGGSGFSGGGDGTGAGAFFTFPSALTTDGTNLYVLDAVGETVRKVVIATGTTTTLAGVASAFGTCTFQDSTDGTGTTAGFCDGRGITIDITHTELYVADSGNFAIRKIDISTGNTTTLVGGVQGFSDSTDGTGATARFDSPIGISSDASTLYVADTTTLRKVDIATGNTVTFAGSPTVFGASDSTDGTGATASFGEPEGFFISGTNLYLADPTVGGLIRRVSTSTGNTVTIAGTALPGMSDSTDGTGATARFDNPAGVTSDGTNLYIADSINNLVRKTVIATGNTTTLAGQFLGGGANGDVDSTDGTGATAQLSSPSGIVIAGDYVYITEGFDDTIRKISILTGDTTTLAGSFSSFGTTDSTDGTGATAEFEEPEGIASDGTYLYVADEFASNIRKISIATGETTTLAGGGGFGSSDSTDGTGATAQFENPEGIVAVGTKLYVVDWLDATVRQVDTVTGNTITFAGQADVFGSTNGIGILATFGDISNITSDGNYLYVDNMDVDTGALSIRSINLKTAEVRTYLGTGGTINLSASSLPSIMAMFAGSQGLFFTNDYSAVYLSH